MAATAALTPRGDSAGRAYPQTPATTWKRAQFRGIQRAPRSTTPCSAGLSSRRRCWMENAQSPPTRTWVIMAPPRHEGGPEVDRSFRMSGRRPAWPLECGGLREPPQASQLWLGKGAFDPSRLQGETNSICIASGGETGGAGVFGYRPRHAEPVTGHGAKAAWGLVTLACRRQLLGAIPGKNGRSRGARKRASASRRAGTGSTHGASRSLMS